MKAGKKDEDPTFEEVLKRKESCPSSAKGYELGTYFLLPAARSTFEKEARDKVRHPSTQPGTGRKREICSASGSSLQVME